MILNFKVNNYFCFAHLTHKAKAGYNSLKKIATENVYICHFLTK